MNNIYELMYLSEENGRLQTMHVKAQRVYIDSNCLVFVDCDENILLVLNQGVWASAKLINGFVYCEGESIKLDNRKESMDAYAISRMINAYAN